ncbi:MAG: AraC family transcriptional regulator, partial [Bacteroidota bacterium]
QFPLLALRPEIDLAVFWQELKQWQERLPHLDGAFFEERIFGFFQLLASAQPTVRLWDHLRGFQELQPKGLLQFLEANYDKPFTIEDYAYLSGRSVSTFRREFKAKFGQTPRRWIIARRLQKAQEYLTEKEYSVSQAALAVGYEHTSHFIAAYKKHFGYTPGQRGDLGQIPLS